MSFSQTVGIAISLNDPVPEVLQAIKKMSFLRESELHLISIQLTTSFVVGLGESAIIYPMESDQKKIEELTLKKLSDVSEEFLPPNFQGKLVPVCLFSDDPKRAFCDYVKENKLDTVIVASREKRGLFESSFAQYVTKHAQANVLILKKHNEGEDHVKA